MISKEFPYCSVLARGCGGRVGVSAPGRFFHGKPLQNRSENDLTRPPRLLMTSATTNNRGNRRELFFVSPTGGDLFFARNIYIDNISCPDPLHHPCADTQIFFSVRMTKIDQTITLRSQNQPQVTKLTLWEKSGRRRENISKIIRNLFSPNDSSPLCYHRHRVICEF